MGSLVVLTMLLFFTVGFARRESSFDDLKPRNPREIYRSEGGRIESYDPQEYRALCEAEFGVKRFTIEPNSLVLPAYKDSHVLLAVTEGRLRAGIVSPFSDRVTERSVFEIRKGDVMAIPKGFTVWFYNDGNKRARVIDFADTTTSSQCGRSETFYLAGGKEERARGDQQTGTSLLHGFSKDLLAQAWGVDDSAVQRVLEGQKGRVIVKVNQQHRRDIPTATNGGIYMDFVYRVEDAHPDVSVPRGGELRQLNSMKFRILKNLGLSASCFKLQPGALAAPLWTHNADKILYTVRGRGRVQVVRENGEQAVDAEMNEGSLMVIPANFPVAKLAGEDGFDFGVVYKTSMPVESFLAGRNSVYKGIPAPVMSSSLQIDDKLQQKLEEGRTEEAYIFPARRQPKKPLELESFQFVEDLVRVLG